MDERLVKMICNTHNFIATKNNKIIIINFEHKFCDSEFWEG